MKRVSARTARYITALGLVIVVLIAMTAAGVAGQGPGRVLLPVIRYDAAPTPPSTPTPTPYSAAAALYITPFRSINASTFTPSAFVLDNQSLNGERLTELRIDLSTAIFPDMVFDPFGAAGDLVAKDLTVDVREGLSFNGREYEAPRDGGFDVLTLRFANFDRGDRFEFSVDVDPTSIRGTGAPGPGESGSVGGLELVGATVTATFDNGETFTGQVFRMAEQGAHGANHSGAVAVVRSGLPPRPQIALNGVTPPTNVAATDQTVRVSGPVGQPFIVLVVEGALFTAGLPNGGFDIDPFEANSAIAAREYQGVIGPSGTAEIPVALSRSLPEGGINLITAVFDDHYGLKGLVAPALVLELQ